MNPSEHDIDATASHFGVAAWTVQTALVNHGYVDRGTLKHNM
jgi:hypothetical protein